MKKKPYIILLFCVAFFNVAIISDLHAQQDSQYTQYMYAANIINPAYVGSRDVLSLTSQYRAQWIGIEGAPRTFNITSNGPLDYRNGKIGLGLNAIHETIGPETSTSLTSDISYKINLDRYTFLSFGIKGGMSLLNIDYSKLDIFNTTDPTFQVNVDNRLNPIVGAGVYAFSDLWYAGLSIPNFLTTRYYDDTSQTTARERPTFYALGGYVFYINPDLKFKPTFLTKFTSGAPMVVDLSANFLFNEKFTAGLSYRFGIAINALAGFQASESLFIGYSYDYETTELVNYTSGSHGIFVRFDIGSRRDLRLLTPRFF